MPSLKLEPRGPFDLRQAIGFGFGPVEAGDDDVLRLALPTDTGGPVGVELRQAERDGPVAGKVHVEEDPAAVAADGAAWTALGGATRCSARGRRASKACMASSSRARCATRNRRRMRCSRRSTRSASPGCREKLRRLGGVAAAAAAGELDAARQTVAAA